MNDAKQDARSNQRSVRGRRLGTLTILPALSCCQALASHPAPSNDAALARIIPPSRVPAPRPPASAPPPAPLPTAELRFLCDPACTDVVVDGRSLGPTPISHTLKAGLHALVFRRAGEQTVPAPLELAPGDSGEVSPDPGAPWMRACPDKCEGTVEPEAFTAALGAIAEETRPCYLKALEGNPMLQGRLQLALRLSEEGVACDARIVEDQLGNAAVAACTVSQLLLAHYPRGKGGCIDVQLPLRYAPEEPGGPSDGSLAR